MKKYKWLWKIVAAVFALNLAFLLFCGALTLIDYQRFKNADGIIKPIIPLYDYECKCQMDRTMDGLCYTFTYHRDSPEEWEESVVSGSFHFPLDAYVIIHKEYQ